MKVLPPGLLDEMTSRLVAELHPQAIFLFGSHAWGQADEDSDVDLMVVMPEPGGSGVEQSQRAHHCLRGLGVPKDVLVVTRADLERFRGVRASLIAEVLERGKVLYGSG